MLPGRRKSHRGAAFSANHGAQRVYSLHGAAPGHVDEVNRALVGAFHARWSARTKCASVRSQWGMSGPSVSGPRTGGAR